MAADLHLRQSRAEGGQRRTEQALDPSAALYGENGSLSGEMQTP